MGNSRIASIRRFDGICTHYGDCPIPHCSPRRERSRLACGVSPTVRWLRRCVPRSPSWSNAAKYGSFGAGSPEVIDPKDAIIDEDVLKSESVQKAIDAVRAYKQSVVDMKSTLIADSQADIGPKVRKDFDFSVVRSDLNSINAALDEDTQRGTDRIVRAILQDITELEVTQKQKAGVARSLPC